ncbi:MAG: LysR family transcriptional regulator [Osedax symbiont Rs2]|nr:MAG: LysR family transcriptional regulator [Osedax symbiont Rs2]
MDCFNALPIFVAVAKNAGFSAAARELGLSKSAVSKRITKLEAQLGSRLLHRTTRKLSLTEAGERFYQHALQAIYAAQNAEDAVSELQGEPQGLLKINVPMTFGLVHIAPLIPLFLQRCPKVKIDLQMDDKAIDLIAEGFDLAIRSGVLADSTLIARELTQLRSIVCMSSGYRPQGPLLSPADLSAENCLLYSYSASADNWRFIRNGVTEQVKVAGNYRGNSSAALKEALLKGAGIGRLPSFVASEYLASGDLVRVFTDYQMPTAPLYALYPERAYVPAKVRAFLDFSIECFGVDRPYWDENL